MNTIRWGAVAPYFVVFYLLPISIMFTVGPHRNFTNPGEPLLLLITVCVILIAAGFFLLLRPSLPLAAFCRLPNIYQNKLVLFVMFTITLPVAISFSISHGIGFRYSGEPLSESGPVGMAATIYRAYFSSLVLYYVIIIISKIQVTRSQRVLILAHLVNWLLFANGAVDLLWAIAALAVCSMGTSARRFFVSGKLSISRSLTKKIFTALLSAFTVSGIVFFGFVNKLGLEEASTIFREQFFERVLYYLYYRLAVFPSSLDLVLEHGLDFDLYFLVLENEFENIVYRLSTVFQMPTARPDIEGLNRLNYLKLYTDASADRAGASPGPLATFGYFPVLPLNFMFCAGYIAMILNTYSRVIRTSVEERLSIFAMLFFIIVNFAFFHNPAAAFTKIGPEIFRTAIYILALSMAYRKCRRV